MRDDQLPARARPPRRMLERQTRVAGAVDSDDDASWAGCHDPVSLDCRYQPSTGDSTCLRPAPAACTPEARAALAFRRPPRAPQWHRRRSARPMPRPASTSARRTTTVPSNGQNSTAAWCLIRCPQGDRNRVAGGTAGSRPGSTRRALSTGVTHGAGVHARWVRGALRMAPAPHGHACGSARSSAHGPTCESQSARRKAREHAAGAAVRARRIVHGRRACHQRGVWRSLGAVPDRMRAAGRRHEYLAHRQTARGQRRDVPVRGRTTLTRDVCGRSGSPLSAAIVPRAMCCSVWAGSDA